MLCYLFFGNAVMLGLMGTFVYYFFFLSRLGDKNTKHTYFSMSCIKKYPTQILFYLGVKTPCTISEPWTTPSGRKVCDPEEEKKEKKME